MTFGKFVSMVGGTTPITAAALVLNCNRRGCILPTSNVGNDGIALPLAGVVGEGGTIMWVRRRGKWVGTVAGATAGTRDT